MKKKTKHKSRNVNVVGNYCDSQFHELKFDKNKMRYDTGTGGKPTATAKIREQNHPAQGK